MRHGRQPRDAEALRRLLLVRAADAEDALDLMRMANLDPIPGDYLFLVNDGWIPGFYEVEYDHSGHRAEAQGRPVAQSPAELVDLVERAMQRVTPADNFRPGNLERGARQLLAFVEGEDEVAGVEEFATFYDRFVNLPTKVSQAMEIAQRETPVTSGTPKPEPADEKEGEDSEQLVEESLRGLTVSAVQAKLEEIVLPDSVLAEAVTAIRAGKHILLSGPPGTGKSSVAAALCGSVVGGEFQTATATADWTTFDTIGGYVPQDGGGLEFEPGIVLRCLERGRWLIIDELNRADIDKAFGPLFTLLSGAGENGGGEDVTLPFRRSEKSVRIVWADRRAEATSPFAMTPTWRLIGTLNVRDKSTLFQLSFAFLRRFAVVDVPLPDEEQYRELVEGWLRNVADEFRGELVEAAMKLAFAERQIGPAILKDIATFVRVGVTPTETVEVRAAYPDPIEAFLTGVRLYAVPQYEGAVKGEIDALLNALGTVWPNPPARAWSSLKRALEEVALV